MHWELTPIVVLGLLAYGLYRATKDITSTHNQQLSEPDLIQDNINAGAAEVVVEGVADKVLPSVIPTIVHAVEVITHHVNS